MAAALSTAENLNTVARSCLLVAAALTDPKDETPYTFRKVTIKGEGHFRFTQRILVNGELVEVTVRTLKDESRGEGLASPENVERFLDNVMPSIS
jgi:hypothetical protein